MNERDSKKKNMFANFGVAAMHAAFLEKTVLLLVVAANHLGEDHPIPASEVKAAIRKDNDKTFGQLIGLLKEKIHLEESLEGLIRTAKGKRDFLFHHFFFDRAEVIDTGDPNILSAELMTLGEEFSSVRNQVDARLARIVRQLNLPMNEVDQEVIKLLKQEAR